MSAHFSIWAFNTKPGWGFHCQFCCSFWCCEPFEPGKDLFFRKFSFVLADVKISWSEKRATRQVLWSHLWNTIKYFISLFGWPSWIPYASHCFQCREARVVLRPTSNLYLAAWAYSALQWAPGVRKKLTLSLYDNLIHVTSILAFQGFKVPTALTLASRPVIKDLHVSSISYSTDFLTNKEIPGQISQIT